MSQVNHPEHYNDGGFECIDVMELTFGTNAVSSFCICNAFKYLWRHKHKNGKEDIEKAKWYLGHARQCGETHFVGELEYMIEKAEKEYESTT